MSIERTTTYLWELVTRTTEVPVRFEEAVAIVKDPLGSDLLQSIEVLSPHSIRLTESYRNPRGIFTPVRSKIYDRDQIKTLGLTSANNFLSRCFGVTSYSWDLHDN